MWSASGASEAERDTGARSSGRERRGSRRVPLEVAVGVHSDNNFYVGMTNDISEGGLFIATYRLLEVGAQTEVNLFLPAGVELRLRAEVRWVRDPRGDDPEVMPGMGVAFLDADDADRALIAEFMRNRDPLFYVD